jgi:hypothetical protein
MNPNESDDSHEGKEIIGTRPEGKETIGSAPEHPEPASASRTITLVGGGIVILAILAVLIALLTK